MAPAGMGRASRDSENDVRRTAEERLNEAVSEVGDGAADQDEVEVEQSLRAAMKARGLDPGDTSAMAADIAKASDDPA